VAMSQHDCQVARSSAEFLVRSMISLILCVGPGVCARAQDARPNSTSESSTTQTSLGTNPVRTTESHTKSGNRSVAKQKVEVLGTDGGYRPDYDIETETIQVDATTTRTMVRTYKWDTNGQRNLMQLTEEEARNSSSGDAQTVRATSSRDVNGNLQLVQREVADTKKLRSDVLETKTTVYLADGNGGFTPSRQMQELQKSAGHQVEVKKTTLRPGANGNWELGELSEKTIADDGKSRTSDERVSRPDLEGRLSGYSRTVSMESESPAGEKSNTVETYSTAVAGLAADGGLHLNQRVTTVQNTNPDGRTAQQVEQPNPGNPTDGLQVSAKTRYTVKYAASGTQQTKTVQVRDGNGGFSIYSVETQKSDQVPPVAAPTAASDKSK
jgi:hypothetical protein